MPFTNPSCLELTACEPCGTGKFNHTHPDDVLKDRAMTSAEKRAVLASWLSDIRAVEQMPGYRQLDNGALVRLDDIYDALRSLDDFQKPWSLFSRGSLKMNSGRVLRRARNKDDDDDPPPAPASAGIAWMPSLRAA